MGGLLFYVVISWKQGETLINNYIIIIIKCTIHIVLIVFRLANRLDMSQ